MTDTRTMLNQIIQQTSQFIAAFENIELLADRIAADSALSSELAQSAQNAGRTDLAAADFDNFRLATQAMRTMLESPNASVPTGGNMVLAYYKVM